MVRPGRDKLSGVVEVDETYIGETKPGKHGHGAADKTLVLAAIEDKGKLLKKWLLGTHQGDIQPVMRQEIRGRR